MAEQVNGFKKISQWFGSLFHSTEVANSIVSNTTNADLYMFDKPVIGRNQSNVSILEQNEFATSEWVKKYGGIQSISINGKTTYRSGGENMIFINPGPGIGVGVSDNGTVTISNTGGSGGESVQANFMTGDPSDPSFIENRIAYYNEGSTFTQIGTASGSATTEGEYSYVRDSTSVSSINFEPGMTYRVEDTDSSGFTTFDSVAVRIPSITTITESVQAYSVAVGNPSLADDSLEDNGEPVLVIKDGSNDNVLIITKEQKNYLGVIISRHNKIVGKTLDEELLPSSAVLSSQLAPVALSNSYDDLDDKPAIPDLTGYATESYVDNAVAAAKGLVWDTTTSASYNQQPGTFLASQGCSSIYLQLGAASGDNMYEFSGYVYGVSSITFQMPFGYSGVIFWPEGTSLTNLDPNSAYVYSIMMRYQQFTVGHFQKYVTLS